MKWNYLSIEIIVILGVYTLGELHTKKEGMAYKTILGDFFQNYKKSEGITHKKRKNSGS